MVREPLARLTRSARALWDRPLPEPPARWRRGPWRDGAFTSPARSVRLVALLGPALGVAFAVCFLTGVLSHLIQHPPGWFWWPSRPVALYRVTQGVHVATGLAIIPLLGAKLWATYPRLFEWPPVRNAAHALERAGVAVLVAAALFQLVTGVLNISLWYDAMPFFFPAAHYWTAWLAAGAILAHVGVKLPVVRAALRRPVDPPRPRGSPARGGLTRRGVLGAVAASAGVITVSTVGQTVAPLAGASLLAPRRPGTGPQGVPVNRSAEAAGVTAKARDPGYRLELVGPGAAARLALADLAALPQHTESLPIACVEGWSAGATWTGVRLGDLAALVDADPERSEAYVESLQTGGEWRAAAVAPPHLRDPLTLLALRLHGQPLHLDHGFPCRLIAPNRPGVLQTKWVARITFQAAL
jgi:DMSO/TMAO reductase YedYZ molybdopterin-dependent catalytic subunit